MAEHEEELKSLLMKVKEESEKAGLKLKTQKTEIMAFSPITSWQIDGETVETLRDYFLGLQNQCSHGDCITGHHWSSLQRLTPWKKSYDQPRQRIKKQRHCFADRGLSSQSYGFFLVVMNGCESWTIKKAEC